MLPSLRAPGRGRSRLALGAAVFVAIQCLSGCASVGPQPALARLDLDAAANSTRALQSVSPDAAPAAWPAGDWWRAYGDPQLDQLVEGARDASPTIAGALARVRQAAALEGLAARSEERRVGKECPV